jgi:hypothetical protein
MLSKAHSCDKHFDMLQLGHCFCVLILCVFLRTTYSINTTTVPDQLPPRCKTVPGRPDWPSEAEWEKLQAQVAGRLQRPPPPAASCHGGSRGPSCAAVNAGWHTAEFHVNHPTSTLWQNWNNYSCPLDSRSQCSARGYPIYVVAAREYKDVKAAVDFARTKNIRLNIKGTGHDFLGRLASLRHVGELSSLNISGQSNHIHCQYGRII